MIEARPCTAESAAPLISPRPYLKDRVIPVHCILEISAGCRSRFFDRLFAKSSYVADLLICVALSIGYAVEVSVERGGNCANDKTVLLLDADETPFDVHYPVVSKHSQAVS
ncbi:hypothetical protein ABIB82_006689 [Bradyrhizobium sp. i1.8.4]